MIGSIVRAVAAPIVNLWLDILFGKAEPLDYESVTAPLPYEQRTSIEDVH